MVHLAPSRRTTGWFLGAYSLEVGGGARAVAHHRPEPGAREEVQPPDPARWTSGSSQAALMRHSDPKLTLRTYGRLRAHDLNGAVIKNPVVLPERGRSRLLSLQLSLATDATRGRVSVGDKTTSLARRRKPRPGRELSIGDVGCCGLVKLPE